MGPKSTIPGQILRGFRGLFSSAEGSRGEPALRPYVWPALVPDPAVPGTPDTSRTRGPSKPYGFIGFGAMDVTKPYECIWLGDISDAKPYAFIGCRWAFISQTPVTGLSAVPYVTQ